MPDVIVAILGLTHPHSPYHLRTLQLSPRVDGIVLWDPDEDVTTTVTRNRSKVRASYTELARLFEQESINFAVVTARNDLNASVCNTALNAGVHILSEKPVACRPCDIRCVIDTATRVGRKFGVCYINRFQPTVQRVRQLIKDGILGRITSCEARLITSQVKFRNPSLWLFDREKAGGGILSWLGCHPLDLMRYITGKDVSNVTAISANLGGEPIGVEDVASVSLRFNDGAIGSLQAGYQLPISAPGYSKAAYDTYLAFRGTEGHLFWNPTEQPINLHVQSSTQTWQSEPTRIFQFDLPDCEAYGGVPGLEFLHAFIDAILDDGEAPATGYDALEVARIIDAAYESSRTGRHINL